MLDQTLLTLSAKNPNTPEEAPLRQPNEILEAMATLDTETADVMNDLKLLIGMIKESTIENTNLPAGWVLN